MHDGVVGARELLESVVVLLPGGIALSVLSAVVVEGKSDFVVALSEEAGVGREGVHVEHGEGGDGASNSD